jgi:hypothetical protein
MVGYVDHHTSEFRESSAEALDHARAEYGGVGTSALCWIVQNSKVDPNTGSVALPSESNAESSVIGQVAGSATKATVDNIYQVAQDASEDQLGKASLDAGCTEKSLSDATG